MARALDSMKTFVEAALVGSSGVDEIDEAGNTPLMIAASRGDARGVELLLSMGAGLEGRNRAGNTALIMGASARANPESIVSIVAMLVRAGCLLDASNNEGMTALMKAAGRGGVEVAEILLEAGCSLGVKDEMGRDGLEWARQEEGNPCEALILAWGQRRELLFEVSAGSVASLGQRL